MDPHGHKDDPLAPFPVHFDFRVVPPCIIIEPLGEGAMGHVYRGRHYNLDVDVAVKFLRRELATNREYVQRFQREARIAASIKQENLVGVFDTLESMGLYYTVMELVDGETVESRVVRKGPLSPVESLSIVVPAVRALAALHERRVFHRDVKPSNIIVSRTGQVKLADLGIARDDDRFDTLQTHANALIGTPHYMATEQFDDPNKVSDKADIYAMALTLAFMMRGDHVVEGKSLPEVIRRACEHDVPSLTKFYPDAPAELVDLFARMTSRDPQARPDAKKVIAQMSRALFALNGEVDLADPDAARTFGTAGLPSKLDRSRVQQIKRMMTHASIPPTAVDLSASAVQRNPAAFAPTMVEQPRAQVGGSMPQGGFGPSGAHSQTFPHAPAPQSSASSSINKLVAMIVIVLITVLGAGAATLALKPDLRHKLATMLMGKQPPPTPATQAPALSEIKDQTITAGQTLGGITFRVSDDKTPPRDVPVTASSSDEKAIATQDVLLSGSDADRTVSIRARSDATGKSTITLTARDGDSNSGTTSFAVQVVGAAEPSRNLPPTISPIADIVIESGAATATPIDFTVDDDKTGPGALQLKATSSDESLIRGDKLQLGGSGKQRSIRIQTEPGRSGNAEVSITVADESGAQAVGRFRVTVNAASTPPSTNAAPQISDIPDVTLRYNETSKTIPFTLDDASEDLTRLTFNFDCDNQQMLPLGNLHVTGTRKSRQLTIRPVPDSFGTARVTLRVTDPAGDSATDTFTVTVESGVTDLVAAARLAAAQRTPRWPDVFKSLNAALSRSEQGGQPADFYRVANPLLLQFRAAVPEWDRRFRGSTSAEYQQRLERFASKGQSSVAALLRAESLLVRIGPVDPALRYMRMQIDPETDLKIDEIASALDCCRQATELPEPQFDACAYAAAIQLQHVPTDLKRSLMNRDAANKWLALGCEHNNAETMATAAHYLLMKGQTILGIPETDTAARRAKALALAKQSADAGSPLGSFVYAVQIVNEPGRRAEASRYLSIAAQAGHKGAINLLKEIK